jgi:p-cumate 2,3-dioxygenase subunit beta
MDVEVTSRNGSSLTAETVNRANVEDFLFFEAELLDEWRLDEWLTLFEPGAKYVVPATDQPDGDAATHQVLISDPHDQIAARVRRLKSKNAHAENPHSRTRRLITNVRIRSRDADSVEVRASFLVFRIKYGVDTLFVGQYRHRLAIVGGELKFRFRAAVIDQETLASDGRVSIIL